MKIYTKTGDKGQTSLIGGIRKSKKDQLFEILGGLDELNSSISLFKESILAIKSHDTNTRTIIKELIITQNVLFEIGAFVANPKQKIATTEYLLELVSSLELTVDNLDQELPELKNFILPGGSMSSAYGHYSRSVCRRVERAVVRYRPSKSSRYKHIIIYINRLSDFLFVCARYCNFVLRRKDVLWVKV